MTSRKSPRVNLRDKKLSIAPGNKKILYIMSLVNLILCALSLNNVGYNFFKSLAGEGRFSDFTNSIFYSPLFFDPRLLSVEPPLDYAMTPPLALFFRTIGWEHWQLILWGLNFLSLVVITITLNKLLPLKSYFLVILINCFPLFFCVMRGSLDLWLLALLTLFFFYYQKNSNLAASVILGLLIACKPHFTAFALVFWIRKDISSMFLTGISSATIFISSLMIKSNFPVIDQLRVIADLGRNYHNTYAINDGGLMWDNGLIGFQKIALYTLLQPNSDQARSIGEISSASQILIALLFLFLTLYVFWKRPPENWEAWLISTVLFVFLSPVSASYRLIFFIPVLCYYLFDKSNRRIALLILLLWVPKSLLWVKTSHGTEFVGDSLLNPLLLFLIYLKLILPRLKEIRKKKIR